MCFLRLTLYISDIWRNGNLFKKVVLSNRIEAALECQAMIFLKRNLKI